MSRGTPQRQAPSSLALSGRLLEDAGDRYLDWREESRGVAEAYENWLTARPTGRALSFAAYHAALDREECAAALYSTAVGRLSADPA